MQPGPLDALGRLIEAIREGATRSPALAGALRELASAIAALAPPEGQDAAGVTGQAGHGPAQRRAEPAPAAAVEPEQVRQFADALRQGLGGMGAAGAPAAVTGPRVVSQGRAAEGVEVPASRRGQGLDVAALARRCELKADSCLFAARRARGVAQGATIFDFKPEYLALLDRGKAEKTYLWMVAPSDGTPPEGLERIAEAYGILKEAASLIVPAASDPEAPQGLMEKLLPLLATAQCALRESLPTGEIDRDQEDVFWFLRDQTEQRRVYIAQHLTRDSKATVEEARAALEQARQVVGELAGKQKAGKARKESVSRARYHAGQLAQGRAVEPDKSWALIAQVVGELAVAGSPLPKDLSAALEPLAGALLVECPEEALRERLLEVAQRAAESEGQGEDDRADSAEIERARQLLADRVLVMIGGVPKPEAVESLRKSLALRDVRWLSKRDHASTAPFETEISRPDVDVVMVMIRWCNTHDGPEVREMCRLHNKACVTLPGGYNPSQVAHHVLEQVGERLRHAG